jgi:hypothetical protein
MPADLKWSKPFNFFDIMSKAYRVKENRHEANR